jgi:hypothetical protein
MPAITPVMTLFESCRPPAITGFISPVVVDAVDGHFGRRCAHVGEEVLERAPSVAYPDSACAVVAKTIGVRTIATIKHIGPTAISGSSQALAIMAMDRLASSRKLDSETPTTCCQSISEMISPRAGFCSTIAEADPMSALLAACDNQASETLTNKIHKNGHGGT